MGTRMFTRTFLVTSSQASFARYLAFRMQKLWANNTPGLSPPMTRSALASAYS
jgi:hypothetical protein